MVRLPLFFARRYLFARRSRSLIHLVSGVSAVAVAVPVAAMVILLSVFNGFEGMIQTMYRSFDPDLKISPVRGKVFTVDALPRDKVLRIDGVAAAGYMLENDAVFDYRDHQSYGVLCGIDSAYGEVVPLKGLAVEGEFRLHFGQMQEAYVGQGMASVLGVRTGLSDPLRVYVPRRGRVSPLLPYSFYKEQSLFPSGVFALEAEADGKYIFVPIEFAQELLDYPNGASSMAVKLHSPSDLQSVRQQLQELAGPHFKVESRYEQKAAFYRIMTYEKWGIYLIILLVLVIASFSLIGSLVMLMLEKRKDIGTLVTLGADSNILRRIFVHEGMLITIGGGVVGMVLGLTLSLIQQYFGLLKISGDTFLIDAYPVEVHPLDLVWVTLTFLLVGWLISLLTVRATLSNQLIRTIRP